MQAKYYMIVKLPNYRELSNTVKFVLVLNNSYLFN